MHLLSALQGTIDDGAQPVDLGQSPGEIVFLSAADSEIALVAAAHEAGLPRLRCANLLALKHPLSVDLYVERVAQHAKLVVVRLLGGRSYWPYGVDQLVATARERAIALALLPGDDRPDPELLALSTLDANACARLWRYLAHGGTDNARQFLAYCAALVGVASEWREPAPLPPAGVYRAAAPGRFRAHVALVFYRALVQAADTAPIDALLAALDAAGIDATALYVTSLKDRLAADTVRAALARRPPDVILSATGFAVGDADPLAEFDCPVLQVVLGAGDEAAWLANLRGLLPRDIAMSVSLTEMDGRILSRAIAFKSAEARDRATEAQIVRLRARADRVRFVADLAAAWTKLRRTPAAERRVALVLANYPVRDGRIANGVGLDTPESTAVILAALRDGGYRVCDAPRDGAALVAALLRGPTNEHPERPGGVDLALPDYHAFFAELPPVVQQAVVARWGPPERDPFFHAGETDCGRFGLPVLQFGNVAVGLQPARGYHIDPQQSVHDPALVPPHSYLAFYAWLREAFRAQAIAHVGKHGNLEWLPGKALALSAECWPEAALGPLPHLYPFIVNDPGEGTQAKRRAAAVVIDHLTPPLVRAGSHGVHASLERLIDEYHEAATIDPRRAAPVAREIADRAQRSGIAADCGVDPDDTSPAALARLDRFLCELKDLQIRDGLHVFGCSPTGQQRAELALAIARSARGAAAADAGLTRALAADLALGFDPLDADPAAPFGPCNDSSFIRRGGALLRPAPVPMEPTAGPSKLGPYDTNDSSRDCRTIGAAIDALEELALELVAGTREPEPSWTNTRAVLDWVRATLLRSLDGSGPAEIQGLLAGLAGRRVPPGPSGAPTRGRPDVLPTGRNFYSVDMRAVPTQAAWQLGWKSALLVVERHAQAHGAFPSAVALSVWGTSNMRTGGDDIAQALALLGVRPRWDDATRRVTGFEIMPVSLLDRPRVDVTLRVSGFFRDAFPNLIELFDSAVRAVAALDEPEDVNPIAARVRRESGALASAGVAADQAQRLASARVFGSPPGAYGAGLQALIDERCWETGDDLGRAFVAWGGHAYGAGLDGAAAHDLFELRLKRVEAVLHNQDNREHDLLDSDDYYQFAGGLAASVRALSGRRPAIWHSDHSRPETPRVSALEQEIARIVRARATNPRWIEGAMRHGHKGAFEMAATVDYLFAFAATTGAVADHHFDAVHAAYLDDGAVQAFVERVNPAALAEMRARFAEAIERRLWRPRSNSVRSSLLATEAGDA
jgi:cobaltochelatase CobN